MSTGLIDIIKRSALAAIEAEKPCDIKYGTVIDTNPLKVRITPQFVIPKSMLIVPQHLTDYEIEVSIPREYLWQTNLIQGVNQNYKDIKCEDNTINHSHEILADHHKVKIHNALKVGDKVAMLRQAGGQHFLILDRLT